MELGKRSTTQPAPRQSESVPPTQNNTPRPSSFTPQRSRKGLAKLLIGLVLLLVIVGGAFWMWKGHEKSGLVGIDTTKYQAVFLTNGQVYFGKLSDSSDFQLKITDIYYLQVQQNVQPADKTKDSQVSLAKLGQELHGPQDTMFVAKSQMLFWENLKDDSKVVQAIKTAH
jgi:hypothetical protein